MKIYYIFVVFVLISVSATSQSRKEQIAILTNQIDSLKQAVEKNKSEITNKNTALKQAFETLSDRDSTIAELTAQLKTFESQTSTYELQIKSLSENNSLLTKKLEELESRQSSVAAEYSKLTQEIENKNFQIVTLKKRYEVFEINEFVKNIYASLEPLGLENPKSSAGDSTLLDLTKFNSYLDSNAVYSDKRVANLSGNLHKQNLVKLIKIESVNVQSDHIIVIANVMYDIYQTGTFYNNELLIIIKVKDQFKLSRWSDINLQKMELIQNEGTQNYTEKDFYNTIGSLNK
ncbi:MAG: hypothetical protein ACD_77C00021G0008 [uncultured bacterium]|nr:MAG: hypothetical protein ACD_77C00021G0008 [uncultured bacterium]HBY01847.1 hypothetical protein [Rikenellaceae bacterium]